MDRTIKKVFFFKQHTNHLYINIKENAYIHWIFVGFAGDLPVKKKVLIVLVHQFSR